MSKQRVMNKGLKAYLGDNYKLYRELLERVPENGEIEIFLLAGIENRHPTPFIDQETSDLFQELFNTALSHHEIELGSQINKVKRGVSFNKDQDDSHYWKPGCGW